MLHKLLWALLCASLTLNVALAQDPIKAEPKHYKLDFENDRVQVVHIFYGPHEKSNMHEHPPGVVVNVTDAHLRFTDSTGKVQEVFSKAGEARWFPAFKHSVVNLSDKTYEGVYIAVKNNQAGAKP